MLYQLSYSRARRQSSAAARAVNNPHHGATQKKTGRPGDLPDRPLPYLGPSRFSPW